MLKIKLENTDIIYCVSKTIFSIVFEVLLCSQNSKLNVETQNQCTIEFRKQILHEGCVIDRATLRSYTLDWCHSVKRVNPV